MDRSRDSASVRHQIEFSPNTLLTTTAYWADTSRHYDRLNQVNGVNLGSVTNLVNTNGAGAALMQGILDGSADTTHANGVRYGHNHQDFVARGLQFELLNTFATGAVQHELTAGLRWHHDASKSGSPGGATEGTQQTGSKDVYGLELGLFADLYRAAGSRAPLRLAYTFTDGEYTRDSDVAAGVKKGDVLEYAPRHTASAQLGWETGSGWRSYVALSDSSGACTSNTCGRDGVDARFLKTESLFTVDLSTAYQLSPSVDVYAKLDNVFDEQRITSRGPDGARGNMGRYFGVGLRATF